MINKSNALVSGHPGGGVTSGNPPVICTTTFTNPPYQNQDCLTTRRRPKAFTLDVLV